MFKQHFYSLNNNKEILQNSVISYFDAYMYFRELYKSTNNQEPDSYPLHFLKYDLIRITLTIFFTLSSLGTILSVV